MFVKLLAALAVATVPQTGPTPKSFNGSENYPPEARRLGEQGMVVMRLTVDTKGKVTACDIMRSSGSKSLDHTSCTAALRRVRYRPATDASGEPTLGTVMLSINWRIDCKSPVTEADPDVIQICTDTVNRPTTGNL